MLKFIRKQFIALQIAITNELFYTDAAGPWRDLLDKANKKIRRLEFIRGNMPEHFTPHRARKLDDLYIIRANIQSNINYYSNDQRLVSENVVLFPSH